VPPLLSAAIRVGPGIVALRNRLGRHAPAQLGRDVHLDLGCDLAGGAAPRAHEGSVDARFFLAELE
jgi:hypothetical protein